MRLFGLAKDVLARAGIDVRRYRPLVHDPFEAQRFLMRESPCRIVFDIDAYQGDVTEKYTQMWPEAEIYTFEPSPQSFDALSARFADSKKIHLVNAAASSRTGRATFHINELAATSSLLPRPTEGRRYFPRGGETRLKIEVNTTTLDDFCAQNRIASPDVLKLDIQGNELEALRGAEDILRTGNMPLIFTEVMFVSHYEGGVMFNTLCTYLNDRGYSLFNLYSLQWASIGQLRFGDAIFVSESLRRGRIDRLTERA